MKKKIRTFSEKEDLYKRLNKIEGQLKGIRQMIEDDRYCGDILIQLSASSKALKSLGNLILKNHLSTCVVDNLKEDKLEAVDEVIDLFERIN